MSVVKKEYFARIVDESDNKYKIQRRIDRRKYEIETLLSFKNESSKKGFLTRMDNLHEDDSYTKQLYIMCYKLMNTINEYQNEREQVKKMFK
jgi:hypothetical protein